MSVMSTGVSSAAQRFLEFVKQTGSPYHAVYATRQLLEAKNFKRLSSTGGWPRLVGGHKYYVTLNHSCIFAFILGGRWNPRSGTGGFVLAGSHTDSPCLRIRQTEAASRSERYEQIEVDCYGGGIWRTWFDRGLGVAGRVFVRRDEDGTVQEELVHVSRPVALVPNMAMHLETPEERDTGPKLKKEQHLRPILADAEQKHAIRGLIAEELNCTPEAIVGTDLCLMDATPPNTWGLKNEFVESPRIDNISSVWASAEALAAVGDDAQLLSDMCDVVGLVAWDFEEVGNQTASGALSQTLHHWLTLLVQQSTPAAQAAAAGGPAVTESTADSTASAVTDLLRRSFLLSVDAAHGVHPNYADRHQWQHKPRMNQGPVLKLNNNGRYCTTGLSLEWVRRLAGMAKVPLQHFCVSNDSRCGTTIGPIASTELGIAGADIGIPMWAMHSVRESAGTLDLQYLRDLLETYFQRYREVADSTVLL